MTPTSSAKASTIMTATVNLTREELNLLSNLLNNHTEQWSDARGEWSNLQEKLRSALRHRP